MFVITHAICILPMETMIYCVKLPNKSTEQTEMRGAETLQVFKRLYKLWKRQHAIKH